MTHSYLEEKKSEEREKNKLIIKQVFKNNSMTYRCVIECDYRNSEHP